MILADVTMAAAFWRGSNFEGLAGSEIATIAEILTQGSLDHGRQGWRRFLSLGIGLESPGKIVGQGHSCALHESIVAPTGEIGEDGVISLFC